METGRNRTETVRFPKRIGMIVPSSNTCLLYTSDAADE